MATGVLVVLVGEATKLATWLTAQAKRYVARVELGVGTDTLDSDGDNISVSLPDIEQQVFRLLGSTEGSFETGETVFVLAGANLAAGSALNDMEAHVRTLMWWSLDELGIAVVH